jgi:hypothetical protein
LPKTVQPCSVQSSCRWPVFKWPPGQSARPKPKSLIEAITTLRNFRRLDGHWYFDVGVKAAKTPGLLLRHLESFLSPDSFNFLVVHLPPFLCQQRRDPPINPLIQPQQHQGPNYGSHRQYPAFQQVPQVLAFPIGQLHRTFGFCYTQVARLYSNSLAGYSTSHREPLTSYCGTRAC